MDQSNVFDTVLVSKPNRNKFDFKHSCKMSFKMGYLYPTMWEPIIPGDNISISVQNMLRMAPLIAPIMDRIHIYTYSFFVPNRLLWPNWENFITDSATPNPVHPFITLPFAFNSPNALGNYMGIPPGAPIGTTLNALPFAAYELIFLEWFCNQYLNTDDFEPLSDGENVGNYLDPIINLPRPKGWPKDYFTAALPEAQRGDPVTLPLVTGDVPVTLDTNNPAAWTVHDATTGGPLSPPTGAQVETGTNAELKLDSQAANDRLMMNPNGTLIASIQAQAATVNALREAFALQRFYERDNFGGQRYIEVIRAHFGVISKDARHQRPELIGFFKGVMSISEVLQTASPQSTATDPTAPDAQPLGTMAGHAISVNGSERFGYYATEHGILMNLICVLPEASYYQGLERKWSHRLREDYPWPELANIGEQAILNREINVDHASPDDEWGYVPRYSEWKSARNTVKGEFQGTLDFWHTARDVGTTAALNESFVMSGANVPARYFAVQYTGGAPGTYAADQIFGYIYNDLKISRLLPYYGKPSM